MSKGRFIPCPDGPDCTMCDDHDGLTIREMQEEAFENSKAHGFHEPLPSFGDLIALIHSELSEALEEYRMGRPNLYFEVSQGGINYLSQEPVVGAVNASKPEGIGPELADAVIRLGDMAGILGIDLEEMVKIKMAYNKTRPYRHGGKKL
jgi:NTP pyrophosphatase (non-canonical NTP hydrolase)